VSFLLRKVITHHGILQLVSMDTVATCIINDENYFYTLIIITMKIAALLTAAAAITKVVSGNSLRDPKKVLCPHPCQAKSMVRVPTFAPKICSQPPLGLT